jgi:hypothetical protein
MKIIGIIGQKRSGKDSLSYAIQAKAVWANDQKISGPLKASILSLFPTWKPTIFEDNELKEKVDPKYGISPRQIAQFFGYDILQILSEKFPRFGELRGVEHHSKNAEDILRMTLADTEDPPQVVVISDLRTPSDVEAIRNVSGTIVKLERPVTDKPLTPDMHPTESYVVDFQDYDIKYENSGTLEDLQGFADTVLTFAKEHQ